MPALSIGRRLGLGFGAVIAVFVVLLVRVRRDQQLAVNAQQRLTTVVLPRAERARELERAVLYVGIGVRAYLLAPDAQTANAFNQRVQAVRDAESALVAMPKDADGRAMLLRLLPAVQRYLQRADSVVTVAPTFSATVERTLTESREAAVTAIRQYSALQEAKRDSSMQVLSETRDQVSRSVVVALLCGLGLATAVALWTARTMTGAVRRLMVLAQAFERGDWPAAAANRPALDTNRRGAADEFARLGAALHQAGDAIVAREQELQARTFVAMASASTLDAEMLASEALAILVAHARCAVAVVHLRDRLGRYEPVARHALTPADAFRVGDGVAERAAAARRPVHVRDTPARTDLLRDTTLQPATIVEILAIPLLVRDEVAGVVTVGSLTPISAQQARFLEAAALQLGVGLENARVYADVQQLLAEVREQRAQIAEQVEALQAQYELVQAQNEEIQAQTEEIQAQNEELQAQSEEITAQNHQLQEQSRHLLDVDARKNHFLGLLAHELRNPLAAVSNCTQVLLADGHVGERIRRSGTIIERQVRQLRRLIDDLLDVTRIEHGKLLLDATPVDIRALLRDAVSDQRTHIDHRRLAVDLILPEHAVRLLGDRARLAQMFGNLIDNAVKFTEPGGSIQIRAGVSAQQLTVTVADTGVGIDASVLPHLFEPFVQSDATQSRTNGGLGLGLSLVRAIAEMHGGSAHVHSEGPNRGTVATITLPIRTPQEASDEQARRAGTDLPRLRILVVEDNLDAAASLSTLLQLEGHTVETAADVTAGLTQLRTFRPDVVLCDIGLPRINGYEFARRVRADADVAGVFLVALTGYTAPTDRAQAAAAGFDRHLGKPAEIDTLRDLFRQAASRRPAPDE